MAVPVVVQLLPRADTWLRLAVVAGMTGTPEGTLKGYVLDGMDARKLAGSWHTTLEIYNGWVETQGERRGYVRAASIGAVEKRSQEGRAKGRGGSGGDKGSGADEPGVKAKGARRGKRRGLTVVYEVGSILADDAQPEAPANDD